VIRRGIDLVSSLIIPCKVLRTRFAQRGFGCKPLILQWIGEFLGPVTEKGFFGFTASKRWGAGTARRRESEETVR